MKIAYVVTDLGVPIFGTKGCSIHVQEIVRSFVRRGDSVEIFAARVGGVAPPDLSHCTVHELQVDPLVADRECSQREIAQRAARQVADGAFDLVYERYSLWSHAVQCACRQGRIDSILEVNAPLVDEQQTYRNLQEVDTAHISTRLAFENASLVVAVSDEVRDYVQSVVCESDGTTNSVVAVVPNGVDTARFNPQVPSIRKSANYTIGFMGTLKPWHGVDTLIAAFERLLEWESSAELKIVGQGPQMPELVAQVRRGSCRLADAVDFVGSVHPSQMPHYLTGFDVAVAPYPASKGFYFSPLKLYEYMAAGLPVIASATGQIQQLIQHGENGLLYKPGDVSALTATLIRLAMEPETRAQLGSRARLTVMQRHSWNQTLEAILGKLPEHTDITAAILNPKTISSKVIHDVSAL